jgi:hypothetical protein
MQGDSQAAPLRIGKQQSRRDAGATRGAVKGAQLKLAATNSTTATANILPQAAKPRTPNRATRVPARVRTPLETRCDSEVANY